MRNYFIIFLLIVFIACNPQSNLSNDKPKLKLKTKIRHKIIDCISTNERISDNLKNSIELIKKSKKPINLIFNKMIKDDNDREIIRSCKREVFQEIRNINK